MQHTEIPNELSNRRISAFGDNPQRILKVGDKVIYASIRRYMNSETRECFPSIRRLKEKTGCSQNKIYDAIDRLIQAGFIERKKKLTPNGKWSNYYYFPESEFDKHFEMFTGDFLDLDLPINIKEYYMDLQQYLYDKDSGVGKCSYSNTALATKIGLSIPSIRKYNQYLINHGFLSEEITGSYDDAGLPVILKSFNLSSLQQASLWIKAVTETVQKHDIEIGDLQERVYRLEQQNAALQKELSLQRNSVDVSYTPVNF